MFYQQRVIHDMWLVLARKFGTGQQALGQFVCLFDLSLPLVLTLAPSQPNDTVVTKLDMLNSNLSAKAAELTTKLDKLDSEHQTLIRDVAEVKSNSESLFVCLCLSVSVSLSSSRPGIWRGGRRNSYLVCDKGRSSVLYCHAVQTGFFHFSYSVLPATVFPRSTNRYKHTHTQSTNTHIHLSLIHI